MGPFLNALFVENVLSLRLALGFSRSVHVCRGRIRSVWPWARFCMLCLSRTFSASDWLRTLVVTSLSVLRLISWALFVENVLSLRLALGPFRSFSCLSRARQVCLASGLLQNELFVENVLSYRLASRIRRSIRICGTHV